MTANYLAITSLHSRSSRRTYALLICLVATMALFFSATLCLAQSDLVRLIPADAPVLAGMHRTSQEQRRDTLWLATQNNADDLKQLVVLTDDPARRIDQVVVSAWAADGNSLGSHLVVAQGRFSLASAAATSAHPVKMSYAGVPVLVVDSARGAQPGARWLAVPQQDLALFGTPSAVQYALDRYRSGAAADSRLIARLRNAHAQDTAWSSIALGAQAQPSRFDIGTNAATFLPCLNRMREVDLGVRMGKTVKVEVHTVAHGGEAAEPMECMNAALFGNFAPRMRVALAGNSGPDLHVTMARGDYDRWLDTFRKSRLNQTLEALLSPPSAGAAHADDLPGAVK